MYKIVKKIKILFHKKFLKKFKTKFSYKTGYILAYNLTQYLFIGGRFWQIHHNITFFFLISSMFVKFLENKD